MPNYDGFNLKVGEVWAYNRQEHERFGYELEIEGENLPPEVQGWDIHEEGSLRGGFGRGMEYVTRGSVSPLALRRRLRTLQAALTAPGVVVRPSHRTSVHIHHNVRDKTFKDVFGFIVVFSMFEPLLLSICGEQRSGNLFCISSYETGDIGTWFEQAIDLAHRNAHRNIRERGKYAALNVDHLRTLGTVEIRCFPATIDAEVGSTWAEWISKMFDVAEALPITGFMEIVDRTLDVPTPLIEHIFGIRPTAEQVELVRFGCQNAYELARLFALEIEKDVKPSSSKAAKKQNIFGGGEIGLDWDAVPQAAAGRWMEIPERHE